MAALFMPFAMNLRENRYGCLMPFPSLKNELHKLLSLTLVAMEPSQLKVPIGNIDLSFTERGGVIYVEHVGGIKSVRFSIVSNTSARSANVSDSYVNITTSHEFAAQIEPVDIYGSRKTIECVSFYLERVDEDDVLAKMIVKLRAFLEQEDATYHVFIDPTSQ